MKEEINQYKYKPFGLRVLIKKIDNPLSNFGKDIFEGQIIGIPDKLSINNQIKINSQFSDETKEISDINYNNLFGELGIFSIGSKVLFKYNQEIIDNNADIYNVPVELIRAYINETK